ncbi:hypothetical protein PTTG_07025 [Puccinia triticina 1-1 BBBD Race 1]|uniref:Uncharacterized protein n=1 Tax=Puccinia triticina (isolate 1-1 / race 1 (BBBD)) TaxID=630390 RepID=A0A180G627_PUCT1|nr:hypothetical protein PTTG_07025 [Puccinia triticina 1-1 BBBD Race 1]
MQRPAQSQANPLGAIGPGQLGRSSDIIAYGTRTGTVCLASIHWQQASGSSCCSTSSSETAEDKSRPGLAVTPLATWKRTSAAISLLAFVDNDQALLVATPTASPISSLSLPSLGSSANSLATIANPSHPSNPLLSAAWKDRNVFIWNWPPQSSSLPNPLPSKITT